MKYLIFALSQRQIADSAQGTANSRRSVSDYNSWQPANVGRQSSCRFANWPTGQVGKSQNAIIFHSLQLNAARNWFGLAAAQAGERCSHEFRVYLGAPQRV